MREHKEGNADGSVKESTGIVGGSLFGLILTFREQCLLASKNRELNEGRGSENIPVVRRAGGERRLDSVENFHA
jgi:hypothetical protein